MSHVHSGLLPRLYDEIADASICSTLITTRACGICHHGSVLPDADVPVVDEIAVKRLLQLRDQVARPGEDVLGELLNLFERDAIVRIAALRSALGDVDAAASAEARRQAAHALKGAAGNIGAARVALTAARIERNEVDLAVVDLLQREVATALQALRTRLA